MRHGVMVIVVGNEHGNINSNPWQHCLEVNNGKESDNSEKNLKNNVIQREEFIVKEVDITIFAFSHRANTLGKGMNLIILPPAVSK